MGKGKAPGARDAVYEHQSAPLSSLKDPASFAPPPKHIKYHGAAAASASTIPTDSNNRADTTGLDTAHVPDPSAFQSGRAVPAKTVAPAKSKPSLPPRLPPRQNEYPHAHTPAAPPPYGEVTQDHTSSEGHLNQSTLSRLGGAGVSVPGFNIGRNASPPVPPRRTPLLAPKPETATEAQPVFAKTLTPSAKIPPTGTSWAEKQAALKTAGTLRDDASKVTIADARSAASTVNNFRQRHGEQAAAGWRTASGLNQKFGITNGVNSLASSASAPPPRPSPTYGSPGKKPPPLPPPKKKELAGDASAPPIPIGSKPKF
jgi:hypothetical protein